MRITLAFALAVGLAAPGVALAKDKGQEKARAAAFQSVLDCRSISDNAQRLACYDAAAGRMDFVHDQVVAPVGIAAKSVVDPADEKAGRRQQEEQPAVLPAQPRDRVERPQEDRAGRAGQHGDGHHEGCPDQQVTHTLPVGGKIEYALHRRNRGRSEGGGGTGKGHDKPVKEER